MPSHDIGMREGICMLILGRKAGQEIVIDDVITVRILSVTNGRCTIGLVAPASIHIRRGELQDNRETGEVSKCVLENDCGNFAMPAESR